MGAKMVREAASKTSDIVGDGTTTATILAEAIFDEGMKAVVAGINPLHLKNGIDAAVADVTDQLAKMSTPIKGKSDIAQVGAISANNDKEIGDLLADALAQLPEDKRDVILLSYFLGMTDREISEKLNVVHQTVSKRRLTTLKELREYLMKEGFEWTDK